MSDTRYHTIPGGLPPQTQLLTDRAVFTTAYAVIPSGCFSDIVTSHLPFWAEARFWVIARPLSGFAETFSHYVAEIRPGGGSDRPETEPGVEAVLFVTAGAIALEIDGTRYALTQGGYAFLPPQADWRLKNTGDSPAQFHWIRKKYRPVSGLDAPDPFVTDVSRHDPVEMPDTNGAWTTTRFVDPGDMRHDMHVNIVTFQPGGVIPFAETHVMEHGIYVLEGKAVYRLNQDWVEVEAGDFMWLRAFCPQACYAGGPGPFRYLLYKDVNRHMPMGVLG